MSQEVQLCIAGAGMALAGSLAVTLFFNWLTRPREGESPELDRAWKRKQPSAEVVPLERAGRIAILLIMVPFNPFILLGKTLGLGYKTRTGLLYLVLQSCWYVTLVAFLGNLGWLLAGFAIGLHLAAILFGWEFYFKER